MALPDAFDTLPTGVEIVGEVKPEYRSILTPDALKFVATLEREFGHKRTGLLAQRQVVQKRINEGWNPGFPEETKGVRQKVWTVGSIPADLSRRTVEITGPVDRKMMINALNSGADVFMADFEDSSAPAWDIMMGGQVNLVDAVAGTIRFETPEGKSYELSDEPATLVVRPRGWHLEEKHILVDGKRASGSLVDFGLYLYHNAFALLEKGSGPYFYLPKLENRLEARLWNDVFTLAQDLLGLPQGTVKVTVLIETILAAFEMDEILYELKEHICALNAGRWDYIFSAIKKFANRADVVFPDRSAVTMTVPFMKAYTDLMVKTCHKRGAHAMGGMAAFIPSRRDAEVNQVAFDKVRQDKEREAQDGFDGTWVAHPDLVPLAREIFQDVIGDKPHQKDRLREEVHVSAEAIRDFGVPGAVITEEGMRLNIRVGVLYIESWLRGVGAAALYNLMEDAATAEIARAQLWQWVHNENAALADGKEVDAQLFSRLFEEEMNNLRNAVGADRYAGGKFKEAGALLESLVLSPRFEEFLTLPAYAQLN